VRMLALRGVPLARPGRQQQQQARVANRAHLVTFFGVEVGDEARPARDRRAVPVELDLPARHDHPGALMDLVVLELVARREVDGDDARLVVGAEDLGLVGLNVERGERSLGFVDTAFESLEASQHALGNMLGPVRLDAEPLSLREIVKALMRARRPEGAA